MTEAYFNLKLKLEELGYGNSLPVDAVPLVECLLADLLQTTRSLQHYMDLSKDALRQHDNLMVELEPYRCENAKLMQENNKLHRDLMDLAEKYEKNVSESKRKIKSLSEELMKKDNLITKLQHDLRDFSLRGLCADTLSSRNKSRRKDAGDVDTKTCTYHNTETSLDREIAELNRKIKSLEEQSEAYYEETILLKKQVESRDNEITRLNIMLEGGRPISAITKDCCKGNNGLTIQKLVKQLEEMENANQLLKKEVEVGLEKQHEAMLRALGLADKNKSLQEELKKVDALALKVEEDCNRRLASVMNDINVLQTKNSELQNQLLQKNSYIQSGFNSERFLNTIIKEKENLQKEVKYLQEQIKDLKDKIETISLENTELNKKLISGYKSSNEIQKCPTKKELQSLLINEKNAYEKHILDIQSKLTEVITNFNKHMSSCKQRDLSPKRRFNDPQENAFVKQLHNKICESEQKILMLKKENEEYKSKIMNFGQGDQQNYKDIIKQLNVENAELSKENILLSQQLSHYRNSGKISNDDGKKREIEKLNEEIERLNNEIQILKKDKQEYIFRYKEEQENTEKLKRDLIRKQKEIEHLEEENCSYKMTARTGKVSGDHLKEECMFLKEQIKNMQSDVIKEKTLANQIKNIQLETERSSNEIHNELLCTQRKLRVSKDTIDELEKKCKDLQSEILKLSNDKSILIENIRKMDQERDKMIIELDNKTEKDNILEQKIKSQTYEISKLESELSEMKRKLDLYKVTEHKLVDKEGQICFLNGEIARWQQKFDSAVIENKHLQNSLADANGTLKMVKGEYEKSRREVDGLKQQLQHYVAEIRRIEEMLSHKEAERSDMLEQFASLSVEANILENTNHSLESESASKSLQLQSYISKIEELESKLLEKENINDNLTTRISSLTCKVTSLESEIKLLTEEKTILEQNVAYLKQMCKCMNSEQTKFTTGMGDTDSELKVFENKLRSLTKHKATLEIEKEQIKAKLMTTEELLTNARREIVDLKLALQDATSETKSLQDRISILNRREETCRIHEATLTEEFQLPLTLDETILEVSQEEDDDSLRFCDVSKSYSKYSHGNTL